MENKIYGYVYLITNLINGKQYVGQTVETIEIRFGNHCSSKNPVISRAIRKYGKKNFKVEEIDVAYNQEELNLIEGVYISWFNTLVPNGYNVKEIIDGKGRHSKETIEKIRKSCNKEENLKIFSENGKKFRGKYYKKSLHSKYIGVYINKNRYCSKIYCSKSIHLGLYKNEIDAAKAYDIAAIKYFGHDCNLNFPKLRQNYIDNKIVVKTSSCTDNSLSKEKHIHFNKQDNRWIYRWFDKELNKKRSKKFKKLEDAILFKRSSLALIYK